MARSKNRRYKKDYAELFDNPHLLESSVETILWPNGDQGTIWFRSLDGLRRIGIKVSDGPAGLGISVRQLGFSTNRLDVFADVTAEHVSTKTREEAQGGTVMLDGAGDVDIIQYRTDERSQKFRAWYRAEGPYPESKES